MTATPLSFSPSLHLSFPSTHTAGGGSEADEGIILCDIPLFRPLSLALSCEGCDKLGGGSLNGSVLFWAPASFSDFSYLLGLDPEQPLLLSSLFQPCNFDLGFNFSAEFVLVSTSDIFIVEMFCFSSG